MARRTVGKDPREEGFDDLPPHVTLVGDLLFCGACGEPQRRSNGGPVCTNGHGGAESVFVAEAAAIRIAAKQLPEGEAKLRDIKKEQISSELKTELAKEEDLDDPTAWHRRPKEVPIRDGFDRIVETIFVDDPWGEYQRLQDMLEVGEDRTDYGVVIKALDLAEKNARRAFNLYATAVVARREWELANEVVFAAARKEATRRLQHEKNEKTRTKMITDADVESQIAIMFPDEWKAQEIRRTKMKAMVDSMQHLSEMWSSKCRSLQTMTSKLR